MSYLDCLLLLSAGFLVAERLYPRRRQRLWRAGILSDIAYLAWNGHLFGVLLAQGTRRLLQIPAVAGWAARVDGVFTLGLARALPFWAQLVCVFVLVDLLQWALHNLLHRVPALWAIHQAHHSITEMDFFGSMRFHWGESLLYKAAGYPLLAVLGVRGEVLFALAILSTAIGHLNHANLRVRLGPLRYLLNSPEMHLWHHVHPEAGPLCNFGVNLSLWDWLFGTAHLPDAPPLRIGLLDQARFPRTFLGQVLRPLPIERGPG